MDTTLGPWFLLVVAVAAALAFEFVNGFHDTANAVATVIYTRSLRPRWAVAYSGLLNFAGVMLAGVGVAYSVVHLFPHQALEQGGATLTLTFVLASLLGSMVWNLATWYLGLPSSSSHALIGAVLGVNLAFCCSAGVPVASGVPWGQARTVLLGLLISPLVGFLGAGLLMLCMKHAAPRSWLQAAPDEHTPPPGPVRALLIATCGGVSVAHGSNDGQKGMGLMMLILLAFAPATFALDTSAAAQAAAPRVVQSCREAAATLTANDPLARSLAGTADAWSRPLASADRASLRGQTQAEIDQLDHRLASPEVTPQQRGALAACSTLLRSRLEYVSVWVKLSVALALSLGTMVGWKRIVVTVGEKIGKSHLTYAQGAAAELVAAATISVADTWKLPVSTTHVLSSGVAGSMCAQGSGVQLSTMKKLVLAWVLTLPVCALLGAMCFVALGSGGGR